MINEVNKMIHIRPVLDLSNKYTEIEDLVLKKDEASNIEIKLDEADSEAENIKKRYTHNEVFSNMRKKINAK